MLFCTKRRANNDRTTQLQQLPVFGAVLQADAVRERGEFQERYKRKRMV